METLNITFQTENQNQIDAVKAFFKALKIKHTISKEKVKMSEEDYYKMLNNRIKKSIINKPISVDIEAQKKLLFLK